MKADRGVNCADKHCYRLSSRNITLTGFRLWLCISFFCVLFTACQNTVNISKDFRHNTEVFVITTDNATYEYELAAGGFRSIIDTNGTDWLQFEKSDSAYYPTSAASDYRGLPNLVFRSEDGGAGHPGFAKMTSEVIGTNKIRSTSLSGKWSWTWTFHDDHAIMNIESVDPESPYWFLYEGPTAGKFNPDSHIWGNNLEGPLYNTPDLVKGAEKYCQWQTAYFGDRNYDFTFFVHQLYPDNLIDMFAYMGNTPEGNISENGMTVFGFGRDKGALPLLRETNTFIVGFYPETITDEKKHNNLLSFINELTSD